ncbi:hypothetical protein RRG08_000201 [Elysia crispata]|uniref:Uncharacterized protein n=1 Tax=Elysia crispata TaxID=231223 RepID=A0AAE1D5Y7_9GAST|nr:hypothetical protein RRG08_000201 [Elysia crispata]
MNRIYLDHHTWRQGQETLAVFPRQAADGRVVGIVCQRYLNPVRLELRPRAGMSPCLVMLMLYDNRTKNSGRSKFTLQRYPKKYPRMRGRSQASSDETSAETWGRTMSCSSSKQAGASRGSTNQPDSGSPRLLARHVTSSGDELSTFSHVLDNARSELFYNSGWLDPT